MKRLFIAILFIAGSYVTTAQKTDAFVVAPYLQIGANPSDSSLVLMWQAADDKGQWMVSQSITDKGPWANSNSINTTNIVIAGIDPHTVYRAALNGLKPGASFWYRVQKDGKTVFNAKAEAPRSSKQAYRFVAFGDIGAGTKEAKQIANLVYTSKPDFVVVPGDIVYEKGTISDYSTKYWPIYNADKVNATGVPLLRSVPFVGAVGNHDADTRDLDKYPDALAYYYYWDQPLNGPTGKEGGPLVPILKASPENKKAFLDAAGNRYPRMTNFSFNYGNAHWLVLDADVYVDWTDSLLRDWVIKDLEAAKDVQWRFVTYHHPGFNSSREHFEQQQMRLLAPIFEKGKVDIVFNGHVHNYQRSFPMTFEPDKKGTALVGGKDNKSPRGRVVNGKWTLDKNFDGKTKTKPLGVIYIVTGAGGQTLYNPEQNNDPDSWQKFTDKFISIIHSVTVVDVNGNALKVKQVDANGKTIDSFEIKK